MKTLAHAVLAFTIGLQATAASAEETRHSNNNRGWYVGGAISYVDGNVEIGSQYALDENGVGLGAYGGYNFSNWFGLEGSSFHSENMADNREGLASAEFTALSFMPKFTVNLGDKVGLFVKAGPTYVLYQEEYDDYYENNRWHYDAEWNEVELGVGAGVLIDIHNEVQLRLSYDYVSGTLDETWDSWDAPTRRIDATLRRATIGVHYQF